ncbi:MAG: FAD-dependent thymidylate synthase [Patescibacteria group bacterium]
MENPLAHLRHHISPLQNGGVVLLLDTGAQITPEAEAMLQALYTRDPGSVHAHLQSIAEKGPEKFMASFYVGYGHKSIGDCGTVTLFIEGISMLCAKAVQDWMLYAGQEVSTRYVDFSIQPFEDPLNTLVSRNTLEAQRKYYLHALPILRDDLKRRFPLVSDEDYGVYTKAINARAFDILRGFLPAGARTSIAWHTNLRQAADKMALLRHHPLSEVREAAKAIEQVLVEAYPSSFGHKRYETTEAYNEMWMTSYYYLEDPVCPEFLLARDDIAYGEFAERPELRSIFSERPQKTELPKMLAEFGTMQFRFLLDFGSFRDIERHRAVYQRMPLLSTSHGFEQWYLSELPENLLKDGKLLLAENQNALSAMEESGAAKEVIQYYLPMGYRTANRLTGDIPALVYLAELRATRFVHPTLQARAHQIAQALTERLGQYGLHLYVDDEVGRFDVERGIQDIVKKD